MTNKSSTVKRSGEAFHIRHRNFFVGLFLLVPAVLVPAFLVYKLGKSEIFDKWCVLYVRYDSNTGLDNTGQVTFLGNRIGHVRKVTLNTDGCIDVCFRVNQRYAHLVKKDSKARVRQKSFMMGDWEIELTKGSDTSRCVREGDTLRSEVPLDVEKMVAQVVSAIDVVKGLIQDVQHGKGTVGKILTQDTLFRMIEGIGRDVRRLVANANTTVKTVDATLASLADVGVKGGGLIDSVAGMTRQVKGLLRGVDSLVSSSQRLPAGLQTTLGGVDKDLKETETILKAVQKHWLLRKQVKQVKDEEK